MQIKCLLRHSIVVFFLFCSQIRLANKDKTKKFHRDDYLQYKFIVELVYDYCIRCYAWHIKFQNLACEVPFVLLKEHVFFFSKNIILGCTLMKK